MFQDFETLPKEESSPKREESKEPTPTLKPKKIFYKKIFPRLLIVFALVLIAGASFG